MIRHSRRKGSKKNSVCVCVCMYVNVGVEIRRAQTEKLAESDDRQGLGRLSESALALSCSKDFDVRLWSLRTGICLQTLVGEGERNSLAYNRLFNLVAVGTDNQVNIAGVVCNI